MSPTDNVMDKLVSLAKRRGFVFQSSEIYGGLGSVWDYGPLGVELKKNIKERWWRSMVHDREDIEGLDAAILMHPTVWEASVHGPGGRVGGGRLSPPRDGAGDLRQLPQRAAVVAPEDPVRDRADRQGVPERDHPRQLHFSDP